MPVYHVASKCDKEAGSFFLLADDEPQARRLVALNVREASNAQDAGAFDCTEVAAKDRMASFGVISRRLGGTITITRRY